VGFFTGVITRTETRGGVAERSTGREDAGVRGIVAWTAGATIAIEAGGARMSMEGEAGLADTAARFARTSCGLTTDPSRIRGPESGGETRTAGSFCAASVVGPEFEEVERGVELIGGSGGKAARFDEF
ncbi:Hypothetical protein POVN_LOCUS433, partial [uncultured virus]